MEGQSASSSHRRHGQNAKSLIEAGLERGPGIILCLGISVVALGVQSVEAAHFGHPYVEGLVVAILLGMIVRSFWQPGKRWLTGIAFCAKQLLEVAVVLLGASLSFARPSARPGRCCWRRS